MSSGSPAVTDPESRHNLHVTQTGDLIDIGPWSQDQLCAAVKRAESADAIVVLDYGRERLYLVGSADVEYLPPKRLGLSDAPGLRVTQPRIYHPDTGHLGRVRVQSLIVSPEFDILIPAFDWDEPDDEWWPPELRYRDQPSTTPSGAVGG